MRVPRSHHSPESLKRAQDYGQLCIDNVPVVTLVNGVIVPNKMPQVIARDHYLDEYHATCPDHLRTLFLTKTGQCVACSEENPERTRAEARRLGLNTYRAECREHGVTDHDVPRGRCLSCFTTGGTPRKNATGDARASARRAGHSTYLAECPIHGETGHNVPRGKCLTCFTTTGALRKAPGEALPAGRPRTTDNPRAAARRAGDKTFVATCAHHGGTAHSVMHGRCLTCFNTVGARRPGSPA